MSQSYSQEWMGCRMFSRPLPICCLRFDARNFADSADSIVVVVVVFVPREWDAM